MLRRIPWFLRVSVLVAVVLAVSVSVFQSWVTGVPGTGGWTQTQWGPLGPADRDLLVKVRLAGLWEAPTGQQAAQQASSEEVRELGAFLAVEHARLDEIVRREADQLGVLLPTQPNAQQQAWMKEISAATGTDYDRVFVQRLREAHGGVLPFITEVRVSTRNDKVRAFADTASEFVRRHIEHIEATGLVDYSQLPDPPSPGLFSGDRTAGDLIVPILVFAALLLAAIGLVVGLRRRALSKPTRVVAPAPAAGPSAATASVPAGAIPRSTIAARPGENSGAHRIPGARTGAHAVITEPAGRATRTAARHGATAVLDHEVQDAASTHTATTHTATTHSATAHTATAVSNTGPHRFPRVTPPGETTGPRRAHRRASTVESTGPRHAAVRR